MRRQSSTTQWYRQWETWWGPQSPSQPYFGTVVGRSLRCGHWLGKLVASESQMSRYTLAAGPPALLSDPPVHITEMRHTVPFEKT